MQIIKKYANRKLYHINRKQYITLDGIATLIQAGEDVQVIDNESGQDITAPILAQVVAQSRRHGGLLPTHVLTDLIQAGGDTIVEMRRSIWDKLGGAAVVDAEIERRLERLQAEDRLSAEIVATIRPLLLSSTADLAEGPALPDIPTRSDLDRLHEQIDSLTAMIDQLLAEQQAK